MGRNSILNDGVFTKIVGTDKTKSSYELFIKYGESFSQDDLQLAEFTGKYTNMIQLMKNDFELLSELEQLIMQMRAVNKLEENIKYSIGGRNNEYIYAYALFYRHNHEKKDIREIVGRTSDYGAVLSKFPGNETLKTRATVYLAIKMSEVIHRNREYILEKLENKFGNIKTTS